MGKFQKYIFCHLHFWVFQIEVWANRKSCIKQSEISPKIEKLNSTTLNTLPVSHSERSEKSPKFEGVKLHPLNTPHQKIKDSLDGVSRRVCPPPRIRIPLKAGHGFRLSYQSPRKTRKFFSRKPLKSGAPIQTRISSPFSVRFLEERRNPLKSGARFQTKCKGYSRWRCIKVAIPLKAGHRFRLTGKEVIRVSKGNVAIPLKAGHRFQFRGTHSL